MLLRKRRHCHSMPLQAGQVTLLPQCIETLIDTVANLTMLKQAYVLPATPPSTGSNGDPCNCIETGDSRRNSRLNPCEQTALTKLYDCYAPMLYAIAFEQLGSVAASEAVVLDVFVQLWQTVGSALIPGQLAGTQLFQLATQCLDAKAVELAPLPSLPSEGQPNAARGAQVLRAFSQLTEPQQQVLGLALYQGLTLTALAAQSDMSIMYGQKCMVKTQGRMALRRLHTLLSAGA